MATDPTTGDTLRQAAEAAARELTANLTGPEIAKAMVQSHADIILRHVAPAFERVEAQREKYRLALESLTPGGSEFVNDPERCVAAVRERFNTLYQQILQRQAQAAGMREALQAWVDYFDRLMRDAEPGDTVADVTWRYHGNRVDQSRAALAPDAGAALLARLAAAEKVVATIQKVPLWKWVPNRDEHLLQLVEFQDALAAYRKLCPAGAGKDGQ